MTRACETIRAGIAAAGPGHRREWASGAGGLMGPSPEDYGLVVVDRDRRRLLVISDTPLHRSASSSARRF